MAHFYGEIQGNRGEATRMGTKNSGFRGHIRGWHIGVSIECSYNEELGKDVIRIYKTGGSAGYCSNEFITELIED